ncbi:MAG TPA: Gfo/Idh/MocA family oxidoreductase [Planctomycetota bacterium]|nr:Gfo/Idh/MocA family oxidoreductase [Planctomycetota bacterium]
MPGIGVVGYGYWGPNLVRNFAETAGARLVSVCDSRAERLSLVEKRYPGIETHTQFSEMLKSPKLDAVAIATPVHLHFSLAEQALNAGKHVLVEKPLAFSSKDAARLIELAEAKKRVLMVDHTFIYTGAVKKIRELVSNGAIGDFLYYDSVRVNLGLFQHDVNVLWDLAVHDLSILDFVLPERATAVSATGMAHVPGKPENMAYLTLYFASNVLAHIHVNWLSPVKVRKTLIGGSKKMIVYDDLSPGERIRVYDSGITLTQSPKQEDVYKLLVSYRSGDMWAPKVDETEALKAESAEFVRCIETGARPENDGAAGLRIVRILEAASESLKKRGQPVEIQR